MISRQDGSILVVSLVLLLVMTTMSVGLLYFTNQQIQAIDNLSERASAFQSSESCIQQAAQYLESMGKSGPPCQSVATGRSCGSTVSNSMSAWVLSRDHMKLRRLASSHSYQCGITVLARESASGGSGAGFDVGLSSSYGGATPQTKYLYRITSKGNGPNNISAETEVVASMIY